MEDNEIVDLYWRRSETAITETDKKYGRYCRYVASHILRSDQDAEECVNDAYYRAWKVIPPQRPERLSAFLGKITRNLAIDRYRQCTAEKRRLGQVELALSELDDCVSGRQDMERESEEALLTESINRFLAGLPAASRVLFVGRYWYLDSVRELAQKNGLSESGVKSTLFRLRNKLRTHLEKEGILL